MNPVTSPVTLTDRQPLLEKRYPFVELLDDQKEQIVQKLQKKHPQDGNLDQIASDALQMIEQIHPLIRQQKEQLKTILSELLGKFCQHLTTVDKDEAITKALDQAAVQAAVIDHELSQECCIIL
jgi:hypothetical protein